MNVSCERVKYWGPTCLFRGGGTGGDDDDGGVEDVEDGPSSIASLRFRSICVGDDHPGGSSLTTTLRSRSTLVDGGMVERLDILTCAPGRTCYEAFLKE